ncbi:MAG: hypothetical protein ACI8TQ_003747 [Planctomycetota bacterium]|jgi:hypothetical protein
MRIASLLIALAVSLTSCGGASDPAALTDLGAKALGSGDYAEAAAQFDAALSAIAGDTSNDQYLRAKWGIIEAGAHVAPDRSVSDFLSLAKANSATMSEKDYSKVGSWLSSAKKFVQAITVLNEGVQAYGESPTLINQLKDIKKKAEAAGDADAAGALSGLGYLGDD